MGSFYFFRIFYNFFQKKEGIFKCVSNVVNKIKIKLRFTIRNKEFDS